MKSFCICLAIATIIMLPGNISRAAETIVVAGSSYAAAAKAQALTAPLLHRLAKGDSQKLIILFRDGTQDWLVADVTAVKPVPMSEQFSQIKERFLADVWNRGIELERDYSHLPMGVYRVANMDALQLLLLRDEVEAIYEDKIIRHSLQQSLPLIDQIPLPLSGLTGSGSTVAVIDTGVNYTLSAFGLCSAPGVPDATCKVSAAVDIAPDKVIVLPALPQQKGSIALTKMNHVRSELARVYREARTGKMDTSEATKLTYILQVLAKIIEGGELEQRIEALEEALKEKRA